MSCDYCKSDKNMMRDTCSSVSVGEVNGVYRIYYADGYHGGATNPIRFCPMCGEQLPYSVPDSLERIKQDMALDTCTYAMKHGIGIGDNPSDGRARCSRCEWMSADDDCGWLMLKDLTDRLGKLLDKEDEQ